MANQSTWGFSESLYLNYSCKITKNRVQTNLLVKLTKFFGEKRTSNVPAETNYAKTYGM